MAAAAGGCEHLAVFKQALFQPRPQPTLRNHSQHSQQHDQQADGGSTGETTGRDLFTAMQRYLQAWRASLQLTSKHAASATSSAASLATPPVAAAATTTSGTSGTSGRQRSLRSGPPATASAASPTEVQLSPAAVASKIPTPACSVCRAPGRKLHACLSCTFFGCRAKLNHNASNGTTATMMDTSMTSTTALPLSHAEAHARQCGHPLACDVVHDQIYCFECQDYVYDHEMDDIIEHQRVEAERAAYAETNRLPYLPWVPKAEEARLISAHSVANVTDPEDSTLGLRGLNNLGNTCFMNCILQSFIHNPLLRNYFLADQHTEETCHIQLGKGLPPVDTAKGVQPHNHHHHHHHQSGSDSLCMACEMDQLLHRFFSGETQPHTPYQFLHSVWKHAKHLAGYEQQDAHEFFIATLDAMHTHCRGTLLNCHCIIHRVFTGALQSDLTCLRCGSVSSTVDPFWDISLDLRHHKGATGTPEELQPNSLEQCLHRFIRPERLTEQISCGNCKTHQDCIKQLTIKSLPVVVCCHLKRFEHATRSFKIDSYIEFPAHLDMSPYLSASLQRQNGNIPVVPPSPREEAPILNASPDFGGNAMYSLFAVVNHRGSIDHGHYTCYVRHNSRWFLCDDAWITQVDIEEVRESQGYLLFYIKDEMEYSAN
ncbi:ubiquitin carboxyl-terminal hydrolase [Capsaspora owczarzaki ATCC 30864]|uniref:Ubiquitin carboxyl-terminal hydrolase n=1 Tax=Capsaspora owczarzaki (strain ATCC 30864) TaxID=595528 RepID=A0A0D2UJY5_CAPO3|nr:ubiquitin carboxyl-terminal hydrolase [Capsaspora owczarzaki ATCC 30864]KJE95416.1 ubiquitin carboxyl-terminal hydrolase [Capsaspora owczarzaki ATCC 30864]|eukprot:XP_004345460.2 ubiquitin carboxyl-terminal hydrolase [Capsaspora owczarzaki ATCC 30864]